MSENKKPRLAEVLGVEVGEKFRIADYPVDYGDVAVCADGKVRRVRPNLPYAHADKIGANALYHIINHPEYIKRCPRWTTRDIDDAKTICRVVPSAIYAFRDIDWNLIVLFKDDQEIKRVVMAKALIPSIHRLSAVVALSDIIGGNE